MTCIRASFAFDTSTGEITVKSGASIDYEGGKRSYSLTVSATDGEDASGAAESEATTDATVSVRIRVINVDEPGTVTLSQATPRVGSALLATLDDPDGWVVLSKVQWSRADTADGPFTVLNFKYISSLRNASYTPEAADEGKFLKVSLFYIDRQCRVVNNFNNQCRRMAEKTADNAVAPALTVSGITSSDYVENGAASVAHLRRGRRGRLDYHLVPVGCRQRGLHPQQRRCPHFQRSPQLRGASRLQP